MLGLASSGNFLIPPNTGLLLWTVLVIVALALAVVTAAKGRWGWLALGFCGFGTFWIIGALRSAQPGSVWSRISASRHAQR